MRLCSTERIRETAAAALFADQRNEQMQLCRGQPEYNPLSITSSPTQMIQIHSLPFPNCPYTTHSHYHWQPHRKSHSTRDYCSGGAAFVAAAAAAVGAVDGTASSDYNSFCCPSAPVPAVAVLVAAPRTPRRP